MKLRKKNALEEKVLSSSSHAVRTNDPPIFLEAKPKIRLYDYEDDEYKHFKSIHHINIDNYVNTEESKIIVAKKDIEDDVEGYLILTGVNKREATVRLRLWIGINENELIQLLKVSNYTKTDKILNKDWLVFVQPGTRLIKYENETKQSQKVIVM